MVKTFEIMLNDLSEEARERYLDLCGSSADDDKFRLFPIATIYYVEKD